MIQLNKSKSCLKIKNHSEPIHKKQHKQYPLNTHYNSKSINRPAFY